MGLKIYFKSHPNIYFNTTNNCFNTNISNFDMLRYFKGVYVNKNRFISRFINTVENKSKINKINNLLKYFIDNFDHVEPFTYKEAFEIKDNLFQSIVFGSIDISEMIKNLGAKRLKVDGCPVKRKQFDVNGNFIGYEEYDNIYETYEVNGRNLGIERAENLYVIKVWCTSTNKEHWLWIESKYKDNPLEAIASTFRIHENLIPHIKELKRQGDILFVELNKKVEPEGNIVSLTAEQYFGLLTAES